MLKKHWKRKSEELVKVAGAGDPTAKHEAAAAYEMSKSPEAAGAASDSDGQGHGTDLDVDEQERGPEDNGTDSAANTLRGKFRQKRRAAAEKRAASAGRRAERAREREWGPIGRFYRKHLHNFIGLAFVMAFLIVLITESLARQHVLGGLEFFIQSPLVFLINTLLIFAILSVALLFKRKLFVFTILAVFWLALGVINGMILRSRMTPLTTADFGEVRDGISLLTTYFTTKQLTIYGGTAAFVVAVVVFLFIKLPKGKEEIHLPRAILSLVIIWVVSLGALFGGIRVGIMDTFFPNLPYGFRDNGFDYGFLATWLDRGVDKPKGYSPAEINGIFTVKERNTSVPGRLALTGEAKEAVPEKADAHYPNIIIVQLESFMDPLSVDGMEYSEDPMPNFRALAEKYSSGRLEVPSMGAGTANTEFELLTGMSVKFFGAGETPYKTTLRDRVCESLPYDLKAYGYSNHAIHNHRGAFYGRNIVYPNLGFDTFTCLEYMNGITKTPKNWAKDDVLPEQIFTALNSTDGKDFVFTVSVQGHGKYPASRVLMSPKITVTKCEEGLVSDLRWQWEYYANQLYEMDQFVKTLTDQVDEYEEDTVIIFYGDHMPAIDNITEEKLKQGRNIFQTDYIIYSNFEMPEEDQDLYSYQISAVLLDRLGIHNGTLFTYHQNHREEDTYHEHLEALQYDILFGKRYIYDGEIPYRATSMKMGVEDIVVEDVVKVGDKYYIRGQNFTEYSKVNLDGEILKTVYLGPGLLELQEDVDPESASRMRVSQVEKNREILSTTE